MNLQSHVILNGKYILAELIGKGGMAEVYHAIMKGPHGFEKDVCIKRILPDLGNNPGFEAMFLDEARIAALLDHPNIVSVFDFSKDEQERFFIVMEYVDGINLKTLMLRSAEAGRILDEKFAISIANSVLHALHYAWSKTINGKALNVIHRDISPHNILIARNGEIKLTDFGIAKAVTSNIKTMTGVVKGKMCYMSPEQCAGMKTDQRSDLYSLGVVLWEALAGRRLFEDAFAERRAVHAIERCRVPAINEIRKDISPQFSNFIKRLLEVNPEKRPNSALEALEQFENASLLPMSPVKIQKMLQEIKAFEWLHEGEKKPSIPDTRSLSIPGSTATLKPVNTASTGLQIKIPGKITINRAIITICCTIFLLISGVFFNKYLSNYSFSGSNHNSIAQAIRRVFTAGTGQLFKIVEKQKTDITSQEKINFNSVNNGVLKNKTTPPAEVRENQLTGTGFLSVNVKPWAEVLIDGKKTGYTPQYRLELPAGRHKIILRNEKLNIEKSVKIKIRKNEETKLSFDFLQI